MPPVLFFWIALCVIALLIPRARYAITHTLWGNLKPGELTKFLILAALGTVIMVAAWGLKTFKDSTFFELVGNTRDSVVSAKLLSVISVAVLVFLYNYLATRYSLERIFSIICMGYAAIFIGIGILHSMVNFTTGTITLLNIPAHWLGWLTYVGAESFSSLLVAHYFSYIASTTTTESAKRGYSLIVVATQLGNYLGPTVVVNSVEHLGFARLFQVLGVIIFCIPAIVWAYTTYIPAHLRTSDDSLKGAHTPTKTHKSLLDGIGLLYSHKYLLGLASLTTIYEVVTSMLDLQFKILASNQYPGVAYVAYYGSYVQTIAILGMVFGLLGTSLFLRALGIKLCLILYPLLLGGILTYVWVNPTLAIFFGAMVLIKTLGYTLNRPIQEIMFIPTTTSVKTQVKSIIDSICKRGGKVIAGFILKLFPEDPSILLSSSTYASLGVIGLGLGLASILGKQYEALMRDKTIIG